MIAFFPNTLYEIPENILGIICFMATMFVSYTAVLRYIESESERKDIYWKNIIHNIQNNQMYKKASCQGHKLAFCINIQNTGGNASHKKEDIFYL